MEIARRISGSLKSGKAARSSSRIRCGLRNSLIGNISKHTSARTKISRSFFSAYEVLVRDSDECVMKELCYSGTAYELEIEMSSSPLRMLCTALNKFLSSDTFRRDCLNLFRAQTFAPIRSRHHETGAP